MIPKDPSLRSSSLHAGVYLAIAAIGLMPELALAQPKPQPENRMPLSVLTTIVENAINECKKEILPLDSAQFAFKVEGSVSADLGIDLWIVTVGASGAKTQSSEVTFAYQVPKPEGNKSLDTLKGGPNQSLRDLQKNLADTLIASARAARAVPAVNEAKFDSLTVELTFEVKYKGSAGAKIPIWVLVFNPKVEASRASTHSIKLVFKPKVEPPATPAASPTPSAQP